MSEWFKVGSVVSVVGCPFEGELRALGPVVSVVSFPPEAGELAHAPQVVQTSDLRRTLDIASEFATDGSVTRAQDELREHARALGEPSGLAELFAAFAAMADAELAELFPGAARALVRQVSKRLVSLLR